VKRGTWTWGAAFKYRWLRNGVPISGARYSTYKVRSADKGPKLTVRVTGSRFGYTTVSRTSGARIVPLRQASPGSRHDVARGTLPGPSRLPRSHERTA
jgi:hypothetical protein